MQLPSLSFNVVQDAKLSGGVLATLDEATILESETRYKKFLCLVNKHPGTEFTPAKDIDEIWHLHMLRPVAYNQDCQHILGELLDHDGGFGKASPEELQQLEAAFKHTSEMWKAEYGEPYVTAAHIGMEKCIIACRKACKKVAR